MTPSPIVSRGPHGRRFPSVREPCSLCLHRKIRKAGVVEPARGTVLAGTPVRESGILGAHGARSGSCHVSRGVGPPAVLAYEQRQLPMRASGPRRARPRGLVGFFLTRVRPVRGPWFTPPSEAPSGSVIFVIAEPLDSVLMTPGWGVPSACPRSQLSACASVGVTESRRS